jgi:hypothetical protein
VSCPRAAAQGRQGGTPRCRGRAGGRGNPCAAGDGRGGTALLDFFFREGMWIVRLQRSGGAAVFLFDSVYESLSLILSWLTSSLLFRKPLVYGGGVRAPTVRSRRVFSTSYSGAAGYGSDDSV